LLVLGGYSDPVTITPVASSEIVTNSTVGPGPTIGSRGDLCAVNLPDGRVLAIGGLTVDLAGGIPRSDGSMVVITPNAQGGVTGPAGPELKVPRYHHTCTALKDGTVLVTGGVNEQAGVREILQDAWIYQPKPTD
jgi:hypothetical protein